MNPENVQPEVEKTEVIEQPVETPAATTPVAKVTVSEPESESISSSPALIINRVLGPDGLSISRELISQRANEFILAQAQKTTEAQANIALGLHLVKSTDAFKESGFKTWSEYAKAMVDFHHLFGSVRQADRYVHAVDTWIIKYDMPLETLLKYGPSVLGEIAQTEGAINSKEEAEGFLTMLDSATVSTVRKDLIRIRNLQNLPNPTTYLPPVEGSTSDAIQTNSVAPGSEDSEVEASGIAAVYTEDDDGVSLDGTKELADRADQVFMEVVEGEDAIGSLLHVKISHGSYEAKPTYTFYCRTLDYRSLTEEESNLLQKELERNGQLVKIDEAMKEV